jgi:hypothetical protein
MISSVAEIKVDALLAALDEDIRSTQSTLSQLDVLRSLIIKRDDKALEALLRDLQEEAESRLAAIQRREAIRKELADELGCEPGAMTLSALRRLLVDPRRRAVEDRQTRLKDLVAQLKREYALTTALVADCARFNRSLMRVFFGQDAQGKATYNARGTVHRQANVSLVNLHY